mgnify:CR=1 FL=1|tara:strand:+ start:972753 stop:973544 length:792 start_codon:yes stop_codon:yes gene_type:complete
MKKTLLRTPLAVITTAIFAYGLVGVVAPAVAKTPVENTQKSTQNKTFTPPPSADLSYAIKAKQKGLSLAGNANVEWRVSKGQYTMHADTRANLLGKILETTSVGGIDAYGLAPTKATEKRFRKPQTTTTFDRTSKKISFSASDAQYAIKGGEQDRNSAIWQLATLARSQPQKFKYGAVIPMFIAGAKEADPWKFKVLSKENISTELGKINALHVTKVIKRKSEDQKIDIWFAPGMNWYPVRIRFTEPEGDYIDQTISKVTAQN